MVTKFKKIFNLENAKDIKGFFAPGRVNLIGEHTDYNGGHVFPCALNIGTYAITKKRQDHLLRFYSENFSNKGIIEIDVNKIHYDEEHKWANYPKGVIKIFQEKGYQIDRGFDIFYYGNIPAEAGLSSSASIELVTSIALKELFHLEMDRIEMIQLSQRVENEFIGVNSGIMDQFAIGMGKKEHAIFLDTNTLEYQYVPLKLDGISIVIANTNKSRGLADSKYNERRKECERALKALQEELEISSLGDLTQEQFDQYKYLINGDVERKRAKHAVLENRRTIKAVNALENEDIKLFGELMNQSHISLRDDYEVSSKELDTLVEAAWKQGTIGSRMTGAGFGGCTVNLVEDKKIEDFIKEVGNVYLRNIGYNADFYIASIGDGAKKLNLK